MLVRRGLLVLSFAAVASWSGLAGAQYFRADPVVRVSGGYAITRIISDDPSVAAYTQSSPVVTISPSLVLTYDTPRVTQNLTLGSTVGLPLSSDFTFNGQPPSYDFRLRYAGNIPLDPRTTLTLAGIASAAPINGFSTQQDASLTPINAPPADFAYNFAINGTESILRELTEDTNLTQTTNVGYVVPFNVEPRRSSTLTVRNSLAGSVRWPRDTLTLTGVVAVERFGSAELLAPGGTSATLTEPRIQILNDLSLGWQRPFTESLSGEIHAGVGLTISPGTSTPQVWQPTGGASLAYNFAPAMISLAYNYAAMVDIYKASTNLNNTATLRVVLPLSTIGLSMSGSGGYVHSVPIGDVGVMLDSATADVVLTYSPVPVPTLSFNLRGLFARQIPQEIPLDGVTRYGLSFNVAFSYPSTQAADFSARQAPSFFPAPAIDGEANVGQEGDAADFSPEADAPAAQ